MCHLDLSDASWSGIQELAPCNFLASRNFRGNWNFKEPVFLELQFAERKKTTAFSVQQLVFLTLRKFQIAR